MTFNNEYFTSEQVDEQIEQLRQQSTPPGQIDEARLVKLLQCYYRTAPVAQDCAALASAKQRILAQLSDPQLLNDEPQIASIGVARPIAHPRRTRLMRFISTLAAVLVISILLGSWFMVTHMAQPPITTSGTVQSSLYTIHSSIAYRLDGSTGQFIWQQPVPTRKLTDFNHGGSAQLIVTNSTAYATLDYDIYALYTSNGQQRWHVTNQSRQEYFYSVADLNRLYLFSLDGTFSALNATNGTQLWHNTTFTTENGYGFNVLDGNLYTETSGDALGNQKLSVLDGSTGQVRWSFPLLDGSLLSTPLVTNGVVYFSSGNILTAVKEQNGDKIWQMQIPNVGGIENLYVVNNTLYVNGGSLITFGGGGTSSTRQAIYALDIHNGRIVWTSDPGFHAFQLPITNGLLLAERQYNGSYSIAGLDLRTGKASWQVPFTCQGTTTNPEIPRALYPSCSVSWSEVIDGTLHVIESDSQLPNSNQGIQTTYTLKSFDPRTGKLLSEHLLATGQNNPTVLGTSNGLLYMTIGIPRTANTIPYSDTVFAAFHLNNGAQAWQHAMPPFPAPQGANTSPNTSGAVLAP
ncbi:MAG TPA: PQQ-binding-like beta-propeller repeat protein [Ktedonobacteraceae bacterium]|nr:PQQ-binding-like beta-propeller repeat protein [Ktedonobacteraceae bacterium]